MADFATELNCRGVVEIATEYLEGTLPPVLVQAVDRHVNTCQGCRRYLEQMRITVRTLGRLRDDDIPAALRDRLIAAFKELKDG